MKNTLWFPWFIQIYLTVLRVNPFNPHDALKHHFTFLKTDLIFLQLGVLERKFPWKWFANTWQFFIIFNLLQVIFIHYKSGIATAICGLWWMKMRMVNSGLKGLMLLFVIRLLQHYLCDTVNRAAQVTSEWYALSTPCVTVMLRTNVGSMSAMLAQHCTITGSTSRVYSVHIYC